MEAYLTLEPSTIEKTKKEASENTISDLGKEEAGDTLTYPDINLSDDGEVYFERDSETIYVSGTLHKGNLDLGYLSVNIPVELDMALEIVELYMKKLGKLKTILEATK